MFLLFDDHKPLYRRADLLGARRIFGPVPSLIQQRQAIDRQRTIGTVQLVAALALLLTCVAGMVFAQGIRWYELAEAVPAVMIAGVGAWQRREAERKRLEFEAREGVGAGKQTPIRKRREPPRKRRPSP